MNLPFFLKDIETMQHTWLVKNTLIFKKGFLILWYYRFVINTRFLISPAVFNLKLASLIYIYDNTTQHVFDNLRSPSFNRKFSRLTVKNSLASSFKSLDYPQIWIHSNSAPKIFTLENSLKYTLNLFFMINQTSAFQKYKPHAQFRLFYLYAQRDKQFIFSAPKFFKKWQNLYSLLYNIFYFNHLPLVFGSKFFKKETLSLNWFFNLINLDTWRYASFFFTFYISIYTRKINFFFKRLKEKKLSFALITDLEYHFKLLFYLRKNKWFTLALVPSNINPWSVSIALPVYKNDFFVQFFFYKLLLVIRKQSIFDNFNVSNQLWRNRRKSKI